MWDSDESKICFLFGGPGMGRVYSGMWSPCMGRTCFGIWDSNIALYTVVTKGKESESSALGIVVAGNALKFEVLRWARFDLELGVLV